MSLHASIPQYQLYGQPRMLHADLLFHIQKKYFQKKKAEVLKIIT